jgi:hypothetical protein
LTSGFTRHWLQYAFEHKRIRIEELCDPDKILHIDSKVLDEAEAQEEPTDVLNEAEALDEKDEEANEETSAENGGTPKKKLTKKERAEWLRKTVDTIGREGQPGEQIQNVISVGMLSEGWDAKTVTHIMGLRAFTSQLLCEQVVGRGLRRTSYEVNEKTGLSKPATKTFIRLLPVPLVDFAFCSSFLAIIAPYFTSSSENRPVCQSTTMTHDDFPVSAAAATAKSYAW